MNKSRKLIWFNLPQSKSVKTNTGRIFLKLIKKHFTTYGTMKLFNKNNIKVNWGKNI